MHAEVHLKAEDYSQHIHRFFSIQVTQSLFKDWVIWVSYGRIGQKARERKYFFLEPKDLIKKYKQLLNKRLKAENRVGCNYVISSQDYDPTFEKLMLTNKRTTCTESKQVNANL
jgi:predicted DNA-binding WGR domain protein